MKIHNVQQGSQEWHDLRARIRYGASAAPIIMGASDKGTRAELLRLLGTGSEKDFPQWVRDVLFPNGHRIEAQTRPKIEVEIDEELFPTTGSRKVDGIELLASFDGMTLLGDTVWECKSWNEAKAADVRNRIIPKVDYWQVVHQLLVNDDAKRAVYTVSDGEDRIVSVTVTREEVAGDFDVLLKAWRLFDEDLRNYKHTPLKPEPVGSAPSEVPTVAVTVSGSVHESNLPVVRDKALAMIGAIKTDLATDQDFADAEKTVKWCKTLEERIKFAKDAALAQTESIDALFRQMDEIADEARNARLKLERQVKARKEEIRSEVIEKRLVELSDYHDRLSQSLRGVDLYPPSNMRQRLAAAIKGKKTLQSLHDAADQAVAEAKIEANDRAAAARENLDRIEAAGSEYQHLFPDKQDLAEEPAAVVDATIEGRIREYQREVEARRAQEAARAEQQEPEAQDTDSAAQEPERAPKGDYPKPDPVDHDELAKRIVKWARNNGATVNAEARRELASILKSQPEVIS